MHVGGSCNVLCYTQGLKSSVGWLLRELSVNAQVSRLGRGSSCGSRATSRQGSPTRSVCSTQGRTVTGKKVWKPAGASMDSLRRQTQIPRHRKPRGDGRAASGSTNSEISSCYNDENYPGTAAYNSVLTKECMQGMQGGGMGGGGCDRNVRKARFWIIWPPNVQMFRAVRENTADKNNEDTKITTLEVVFTGTLQTFLRWQAGDNELRTTFTR